LQHRRVLTSQKRCEWHDRSIREFQGVVVSESGARINLPKPSQVARRHMLLVRYRVLIVGWAFEGEFCSGSETNGCVEVADSSEASR
jgi:hypothetical protein